MKCWMRSTFTNGSSSGSTICAMRYKRIKGVIPDAMTSFVLYYILLLTTWSKAITAQESSNAKNGVTIMASSKEYLHFILEQLSDLDDMPRPGGIRVGSSSSSSSGSSPPIISEHVISTSPISSGAMPCMSGRSYTLCVSATCRSSRIALGERPTACPSPLRRAFLPPPLCCTARAA